MIKILPTPPSCPSAPREPPTCGWLLLGLPLALLALTASLPSQEADYPELEHAAAHASHSPTGERTLRADLQSPGAQPALAKSHGNPWQLLLTELRAQRPRLFDQFAAPRALRRLHCLAHDEPRPAPLRGPPNTGLPEAGRVAHPSQGPPGSC